MISRVNKRHIVFLTMLAIVSAGIVIFYQSDRKGPSFFIRSYDEKKDYEPLVLMINKNKFMISENPDFSAERFLTMRAPNYDPSKIGQAKVDVLETNRQTAGFISYYKKSAQNGYIWIMGVDADFRGHGFGEKLTRHAVEVLRNKGANYVTLGTRLFNKPALRIYYKLGFIEDYRDEDRGVISLRKKL